MKVWKGRKRNVLHLDYCINVLDGKFKGNMSLSSRSIYFFICHIFPFCSVKVLKFIEPWRTFQFLVQCNFFPLWCFSFWRLSYNTILKNVAFKQFPFLFARMLAGVAPIVPRVGLLTNFLFFLSMVF